MTLSNRGFWIVHCSDGNLFSQRRSIYENNYDLHTLVFAYELDALLILVTADLDSRPIVSGDLIN